MAPRAQEHYCSDGIFNPTSLVSSLSLSRYRINPTTAAVVGSEFLPPTALSRFLKDAAISTRVLRLHSQLQTLNTDSQAKILEALFAFEEQIYRNFSGKRIKDCGYVHGIGQILMLNFDGLIDLLIVS